MSEKRATNKRSEKELSMILGLDFLFIDVFEPLESFEVGNLRVPSKGFL